MGGIGDEAKCKPNILPIEGINIANLAQLYRGIPLNLIFNFIVTPAILIAFFFYRRASWKLFRQNCKLDAGNLQKSSFFSFPPRSLKRICEFESFSDWAKSIFTTDFDTIEHLYGRDTMLFLRFQKCCNIFMAIVTVISLTTILPLNLAGQHLSPMGGISKFEHSTLANISNKSEIQWAHFTIAFVLFILSNLVMKHFSRYLYRSDTSNLNLTLMMENVPQCGTSDLYHYLREAFTKKVRLTAIDFTYELRKLHAIKQSIQDNQSAIDFCKQNPGLKLYECCWRSTGGDALQYYEQKQIGLWEAFEAEKKRVTRLPLDIVFVTFKDLSSARRVFEAFQRYGLPGTFKPPKESILLKPEKWTVSYAPPPDDIYWENLTYARSLWTLRALVANAVFFILIVFFTSPQHMVQHMDKFLQEILGTHFAIANSILGYLSSLLLFIFTLLLPFLIGFIDRWLGYCTRSQEQRSIMIKTYAYLVLIVAILPTFGFTYLTAVFHVLAAPEEHDIQEIFRCFFLPDSGASLINYTIFVAFTGNCLELIRFSEMFMYLYRNCFAKSRAEKTAIDSAVRTEFQFGECYAQYLLIFTVSIMFSLTCPLITPFGLAYGIAKYYVDRHNLFYVFNPSKVNSSVHCTAMTMVIFSTLLQLFMMVVYCFVYKHDIFRELYILLLFFVAFFIFSATMMRNCVACLCSWMSPSNDLERIEDCEEAAQRTKSYNYKSKLDF